MRTAETPCRWRFYVGYLHQLWCRHICGTVRFIKVVPHASGPRRHAAASECQTGAAASTSLLVPPRLAFARHQHRSRYLRQGRSIEANTSEPDRRNIQLGQQLAGPIAARTEGAGHCSSKNRCERGVPLAGALSDSVALTSPDAATRRGLGSEGEAAVTGAAAGAGTSAGAGASACAGTDAAGKADKTG